MKAGRELDALIAEKVFGLKIEWEHYAAGSRPMVITEDVRGNNMASHYSTQIADAWLVVEKLHSDGIYMSLENDGYQGQTSVMLFSMKEGTYNEHGSQDKRMGECNRASTAPLAICLSALKAVGHE